MGDSFPLEFELNEFQFGSESKGKLSPRSYPIQSERKWNTSFLSVASPDHATPTTPMYSKAIRQNPTLLIIL